MTDLVILRPWWLATLPLLVLLGLWTWLRRPDAGGWQHVMPAPMLDAMRTLGHLQAGKRGPGLSCLLTAALLALGLAGPSVPRKDAPVLAGSGALLIAIDMSRSVAQSPALADAQAAAAEILKAANGRAVGLILYNGEAYDIAAPTADPSTLETQIAVLGPDTMPGQGSRPAAALALARHMLSDIPDGDLVLITDGGGIDTAAAAEADRLTNDGARLFLLTLANPAGPALPPAIFAELDGVSETAPAKAPGQVLRKIAHPAGWHGDQAIASLQVFDFGPFVAMLALIPLLGLLRRAV